AVHRRDRHRHGQTCMVEVLEECGLPREISVAPGTETTDRQVPVDAHAPHVVGDSASERCDARDVDTPLLECLPSHWPPHGFPSVRLTLPVSGGPQVQSHAEEPSLRCGPSAPLGCWAVVHWRNADSHASSRSMAW